MHVKKFFLLLTFLISTCIYSEVITWVGDTITAGEINNVSVVGQQATWTLTIDDGGVFDANGRMDIEGLNPVLTLTVGTSDFVFVSAPKEIGFVANTFPTGSGGVSDGSNYLGPADNNELGQALAGETMTDYLTRVGNTFLNDTIITGPSIVPDNVFFNGNLDQVTQTLFGTDQALITVSTNSVPEPSTLLVLAILVAIFLYRKNIRSLSTS